MNLSVSLSSVVSEVVQTLQLCTDRDQADIVGDLSVCLDGMQVDPETFAAEEQNRGEAFRARAHITGLLLNSDMEERGWEEIA